MIPKRLPNVCATAIRNGWCMEVMNDGTRVTAAFQRRGTESVYIEWWMTLKGFSIATSTINGISTPYAQCVRLIKEDQE